MKWFFFYIVCVSLNVLLSTSVVGQTSVEGKIVGSKNEPLVGASVVLLHNRDTVFVKGTISNLNGDLTLEKIPPNKYLLKISYLGYKTEYRTIVVTKNTVNLGVINLEENSKQLGEITINGKIPIIEIKNDTTEFRASSFKVNADAVAEDLVSKIPGITIENGTIKANGEEVKQVYVDNQEFFGNDVSIALNNLPADIIDKVQFYDRASEQAAFTGFKDGETNKTINIKTKKGRNYGVFGKILGGSGSDERYTVNGNLNIFNGKTRISIIGSSNNINEQKFSSQDLLGLGKAGNMPPPSGIKAGGASNMIGENTGINTNHSAGINYSGSWGKKWTATSSYFFNQTNNTSNSITDRTYFITDSTSQYYKAKTSSNTKNYNHRINIRLECEIDKNSSLTIFPALSFQKNNAGGNSQINTRNENNTVSNNTTTDYLNDNTGYELSNSVFYRRKFTKKGRSLFIDFSQNADDKKGTSQTASTIINQNLTNRSSAYGVTSRISYTEPVGKYSLLRVNYAPSIDKNESDKRTKLYEATTADYTQLDSTLSSKYAIAKKTHKAGLAYLFNRKKVNFNVGGDYQALKLEGDETFPQTIKTNKDYRNTLVHSDLFYTINKRSFMHIGYNTETKTPSITELQSIIDNSNPLNISEGNPNLNQQYTHSLRCMLRSVDYTLTRTFFFATHASISDNYIGTSDITAVKDTILNGIRLLSGAQLSKPENLSGYININSFAGYSFPLYYIKSNISFNSGYEFTRTPGLVNGEENHATTNGLSGGISVASNISQKVDFHLAYRGNYNMVTNSMQKTTNENYYIGNATAKITLTPTKHLVFASDANLNHYVGLGVIYDQAIVLWNMSVAYKFLKKNTAELRFTIYDILNENSKTSRTVNSSYIETSQSEALKRYFNLSFSYNIRDFKNA